MSNRQDVLGFLMKTLVFFGLDSPERKYIEQAGKFVFFLITVPLRTIFLVVMTVKVKTVEEKFPILQIVFVVVIVLAKAVNIKLKFKKINLLTEDIKILLQRVDDQEVLDDSYKQAMTVMKTCFCVNFFPLFLGELSSLIMHKTVMPTYIPKNWMEFEQQLFYAYWIFYTVSEFYASAIGITFDFLLLNSMISLNAFSKYLVKCVDLLSNLNHFERNQQFVKLVNQIEELRR